MEIIDLYNKISSNDIDELYCFKCIKCSDVDLDDITALSLARVLDDLWLKDEANTSISTLSDGLVSLYRCDNNIIHKRTRELLVDIYTYCL